MDFPLIGMFNPGRAERGDLTQYAPDGHFIWTNGIPPSTSSEYSVILNAMADAKGSIVIAETAVIGLSGHPQSFPILNAMSVQRTK
jgi:hypothetical protein